MVACLYLQVEELRGQLEQKQQELEELRQLTAADLWLRSIRPNQCATGCGPQPLTTPRVLAGLHVWWCLRDLDELEVALTAYNDSLEIEPAYRVVAGQGKGGRGRAKANKPKGNQERHVKCDGWPHLSERSHQAWTVFAYCLCSQA